MSKEEVVAIVGRPDNADADQVWMWVFPRTTNGFASQQWREMYRRSQGQLFLVFDERHRLVGPMLKGAECHPDEVLIHFPRDP